MGVPSYFGWIVKLVKKRGFDSILKSQLPNKQCNRLYFDFNCLIHRACRQVWEHRKQFQTSKEVTKAMIKNVLDVMSEVICESNPQELLYLAIDGSVPMGKCKQQRYRRFKSIQEAKDHQRIREEVTKSLEQTPLLFGGTYTGTEESESPDQAEPVNEETVDEVDEQLDWDRQLFDFNAISPGTEFMDELAIAIENKFDEWRLLMPHVTFILDDSHQPGEGEHKIIHHIKEPSTAPSEEDSLVIYGLDADLIFLTLSLHHPKTSLIRENTFQTDVEGSTPNYLIVDITCLSQAIVSLIIEPEPVAPLNKAELELETPLSLDSDRLINDYIAINFFLGNDFVSRFYSLSIKNSGCETVLEIYRRELRRRINNSEGAAPYLVVTPSADNSYFTYNIPFLQSILERLVVYEENWFVNPSKYFISRKKDLGPIEEALDRYGCVPPWKHYLPQEAMPKKYSTGHAKETAINEETKRVTNSSSSTKISEQRPRVTFDQAKENYYHILFENINVDHICTEYYKTLVWTLNYYLGKCPDYNHYYSFNYAPLICDFLAWLPSLPKIDFRFSKAVDPYHQLMIILPPESFHLLPKPFRNFHRLRQFAKYFPDGFELQCYGHRFTWECPPRIPILDTETTQAHYQYLKRHLLTQ